MHTFNTEADGTITVGRLEHAHVGDMGAASFVPLRRFDELVYALRFINYLNGGDGGLDAGEFIIRSRPA